MARKDVRLGWKPDMPDQRDLMYLEFFKPVKDLPTKVDLTDKFTVTVYDQGQLGSCTANAIAGAIQYLDRVTEHSDPIVPSRLFIYYNERDMEGSVDYDSGAYIRDGIKSVAKLGTCTEDHWPYDISKFTLRPPDSAYALAAKDRVAKYYRVGHTLQAMLNCIATGFPFVFGISVYDSFMNASNGDVPMPKKTESLLGGHAMLVVGYDETSKRFKIRNSWGPGWGDQGYGTLPFAYLENYHLGADYWTIRGDLAVPTEEAPKAEKVATKVEAPKEKVPATA
jgi:C1A family cysteine protease